MTGLIKAIQLILALSTLIVIHEMGHFLFAKLFGIRVDKFFLFFDVGGKSLLKFRIGETEYGIGWLPLGGYCKISGMIDESMDTAYLASEPKPWEFRSKPAWKRLLVMAGGVLFNFIFAIVVYSCILSSQGQSYIANEGNSIYVNELSYEMGFRNGDRILKFDDYVPENFNELQSDLARRAVRKAVVLRGVDTLTLYVDHALMGRVLRSAGMFELAMPFVVDTVPALSVNAASGLRRDDRIVEVAGTSVQYVQEARPILESLAGTVASFRVARGADTLCMPLQIDSLGKIGVYMQIPGLRHREYSGLQAIPAGCRFTWRMIRDYVLDLKLIATPGTQAYKSVGSFIAIGQVFPGTWDWLEFFSLLGLLSVMLGVMNLIPIPGLDGGHIVFTIYEMVTGRKPSDKFMMAAQMVGMLLLLLLMFLAFGNDIGRLLK